MNHSVSKYPKWCRRFISPTGIHNVSQAVRTAEEKTSGEIIPMIVRRSSALGHLGFQIFTMACLFATLCYIALEKFTMIEHPAWIVMASIVVLWPVSEILSRLPFLQRLLTIPSEQMAQVQARATLEFYSSGFQKTKQRTGVLIFVSLMERKCVVLADEGIAGKLPADTWKNLVERIVSGIAKGQTSEGLIAGIQDCGRILTEHFPASGTHENEISNQLIIKD
jgi:putative membrane protein